MPHRPMPDWPRVYVLSTPQDLRFHPYFHAFFAISEFFAVRLTETPDILNYVFIHCFLEY